MKKRIALATLTSFAVIVPIATVVACGSNKINLNKSNSMTLFDAQQLNDYLKTPFTPTKLKDKAIAENDETFWNGGLSYHAFSQSISIMRGLAHEYGYDIKDPVTKKSPRDKFLETTNAQFITDDSADLAVNPTDSNDIKILKGLKPTGKTNSKSDTPSGFKDDIMLQMLDFLGKGGFTRGNVSNFAQVISFNGDKHLLDDINLGKDANGDPIIKEIDEKYFKAWTVHNDPEVPGQLIVQIEDSNDSNEIKAIREIKIPGMSQVYPVIDSDAFTKNIVPAIKDVVSKTIQVLSDPMSRGILQSPLAEFNVQLLFNEIDFLKSIFFTETVTTKHIDDEDGGNDTDVTTFNQTDEFKSQGFVDKLSKLNNGSAHWLALEAVEKGLNFEFSSNIAKESKPNNIYEWVSEGNPTMINHLKVGEDLTGFANADLTDPDVLQKILLPWTGYSEYILRSSKVKTSPNTYDINASSHLAPTPAYGFDETGLNKSFERNTK